MRADVQVLVMYKIIYKYCTIQVMCKTLVASVQKIEMGRVGFWSKHDTTAIGGGFLPIFFIHWGPASCTVRLFPRAFFTKNK